MNTRKTGERLPLRSKMVFRLWLSMMTLVLLCILFLWIGQFFLFERTYVEASIAEVESRLEPVMEDLRTKDLSANVGLIPFLSKSTNGKLMLTDEDGILLLMYTYGHAIDLEEAKEKNMTWQTIRQSDEYQKLLLGEQYKKITEEKGVPSSFEIGIPVLYKGQRAYVVLYHSLGEIKTVLEVNRRQLAVLSVLLTFLAALLAALLSRQFTRPIREIKRVVDRLAAGDLNEKPALHLQDEIGQLAHSVEDLGQALQRVDVLRKEVIANVSHELRSPLALISGYAEMVRDINWRDDEKREEDLELIIHEAWRMSEMVNDILDYSQFQAGYIRLKKDWYNLCDIVESEVSRCEPGAQGNRIKIELSGTKIELPVFVDALKLSQVLRNLLYNAINHTDDGMVITVSVEQEEKVCRVSVANPGPPIPEEERQIIWERYQRSQHQGSRRQGTGLGLSIVSTILDAHGMSYGVDCRNGLNIFWFSYPLHKNETASG